MPRVVLLDSVASAARLAVVGGRALVSLGILTWLCGGRLRDDASPITSGLVRNPLAGSARTVGVRGAFAWLARTAARVSCLSATPARAATAAVARRCSRAATATTPCHGYRVHLVASRRQLMVLLQPSELGFGAAQSHAWLRRPSSSSDAWPWRTGSREPSAFGVSCSSSASGCSGSKKPCTSAGLQLRVSNQPTPGRHSQGSSGTGTPIARRMARSVSAMRFAESRRPSASVPTS